VRLVDVGEEVVHALVQRVLADGVPHDVLELTQGDDDAAAGGEAHDDGAGDKVHDPAEHRREGNHDDADHERDGAGLVLEVGVPVPYRRGAGARLGVDGAVRVRVHDGVVGWDWFRKADFGARGDALGDQRGDERNRPHAHLRHHRIRQ
jgi:hypothetical protein